MDRKVPYEPIVYVNRPPAAPQNMPLKATIRDRPAFSHVEVELGVQQGILANGHAMNWMDGNIQLQTNMNECGPACCRWMAGESVCLNTFTGPGKITFAQELPGDILPFACAPEEGWVVSSGSFICGTNNLKVDGQFIGCAACLCAQEGAILCKITCTDNNQGVFYAGSYGALTRHEIKDGESMFVEPGLFFAASANTKFEIALAGDCVSCFCGREGFVMKFTGPNVVYTQNRNPLIWKSVLRPHPPPAAPPIQ